MIVNFILLLSMIMQTLYDEKVFNNDWVNFNIYNLNIEVIKNIKNYV